jgi:hypothetical protein
MELLHLEYKVEHHMEALAETPDIETLIATLQMEMPEAQVQVQTDAAEEAVVVEEAVTKEITDLPELAVLVVVVELA